MKFILPSAGKVYNINDTIGIKLITKLRLGFSHLQEHEFKHNFQDTLNLLCSCSIEVESTSHYFLRFHFFDALRPALKNDLRILTLTFQHLEMKILQTTYYTVIRYMSIKQIK